MATTAGPTWLQESDVKRWLRLNDQDTEDDDLIRAVAAMAEPYVERCRPEWFVPAPAAPVVLTVTPGTGTAGATLDLTGQPVTLERAGLVQASGTAWGGDAYAPAMALVDDPGVAGGTLPIPLVTVLGGSFLPVQSWTLQAWTDMGRQVGLTQQTVQGIGSATAAPLPYRVYAPDAETYQGAVMYAAREYRRRNSPAGIETFGDVTSFVAKFDPDIDRALQTGAWARPVIA